MKKILAMVLAMMLVLSMSTAFAAENLTSEATEFKFNKEYVTSTGSTSAVVPNETLEFTIEMDEHPVEVDTDAEKAAAMISIKDGTNSITENPQEITLSIPSYKYTGKYEYIVTEVAGDAQGVIYDTNAFRVQVLVAFNEDHTALTSQVVFLTYDATIEGSTAANKIDSIVNVYDLGSLTIDKTVSGNLGDKTDTFIVELTFNTEKDHKAYSDITFTAEAGAKVGTAINAEATVPTVTTPVDKIDADLINKGTTIYIEVKSGSKVVFNNIPEGVTYTVKEMNYSGDTNEQNFGYKTRYSTAKANVAFDDAVEMDNGITGSVDNIVKDEKVTGTDNDYAHVYNNKGTTVDTGISLDNAPYMILMALVVVAGAALIVKRASANR